MRYLSSLDQTEGITVPSGWCFIGCLPAIGATLWWWIAGFSLTASLIIVASAILSISIFRLSTMIVKTRPEGIVLEKPYYKKLLAWDDIVNAETISEGRGKWTVIITSKTARKLPFPIDMHNWRVDASIWQYLRKYNKANNYDPSDDMLSIWADIPDDIPQEMDYCHEEVKDVSPATLYELREDFISEELSDIPPDTLRRMKRSGNLCTIRWNNVTNVSWDCDNDFLYLSVQSSAGDIISVQDWSCDSKDETDIENARFLLAVIRRARMIESQPAIFIPEHIRKACGVEV